MSIAAQYLVHGGILLALVGAIVYQLRETAKIQKRMKDKS